MPVADVLGARGFDAHRALASVPGRAREARGRLCAWFFSDAPGAAVAWGAAVILLCAVLAWFFLWSPFGAPAAPVYAEF